MQAINKLNSPAGSLPNDYTEALVWQLSEKPSRVIALQILAVPLFILAGLIFLGLAIYLGKLPARNQFGLGEIGGVLIGILLTLVLHELIHGVMMQRFGATPQYGFLWKKLMFYATTPGYAYRRNHYVQIALAPLCGLSVLFVVGMWQWQGTIWVAILGLCGAINVSGAIGDIWMTIIVLRYAATAYVIDERDGIRVFLPRP